MDSIQCSSLDAFSERISEMCACERAEISSSDNLHYAREHGNSPLYQYFVHGGPNHLWRNRPEVRDFLKRYGCILLPDNEAYMELQRAFALSPRSRKTFLKAQQSSPLPNLNPTDDDLSSDESLKVRWSFRLLLAVYSEADYRKRIALELAKMLPT